MARGLCEERLQNVQALMRRYVDGGALPGCACLVSRGDADAWFSAYGKMDVEREQPIWRDAVFRIYSMTKPIVSVALMTLYEEGRFQLDDPVAKFIPAWSSLEVFCDGDEHGYSTVPPARPMTAKDLLTHTSGLTYGFMNAHPVDALYRQRQVGSGDLEDLIGALGELPLLFSPGTRWSYGYSTDVCGHLVQVLADQPLDDFVRERITGGELGEDESHIHTFPLPPSLNGLSIHKRLTITLAWLSPINPRHQAWRRASLWFDPPMDELKVMRQQGDYRAVRRGTLQHEVLEGRAAAAFGQGDALEIQVSCRADAGTLKERVPYALVTTLEVAEHLLFDIDIYDEVRTAVQAARLRV